MKNFHYFYLNSTVYSTFKDAFDAPRLNTINAIRNS